MSGRTYAQPVGQADLKRRGSSGELHQHWRAPFEAAHLGRWASMDTKQLLEAVEVIRAIKPLFGNPPDPWIPVFAAVLGALVGGVVGFIPGYLLEKNKRKNECKIVTTALLAEVKAIIFMVNQRQYIDSMRVAEKALLSAPDGKQKFIVRIPFHYSRVYQAYVDRLGSINPELAGKIIEFHQLIDAVVQDISPGGLIAEEGGDAKEFGQLIQISESAMLIGVQITGR